MTPRICQYSTHAVGCCKRKRSGGRWIGWRSMRNRCDHRRCRVELNGEAPFRPEAVGSARLPEPRRARRPIRLAVAPPVSLCRAHLTRFRAASGRLSSSRCGGRVGESALHPCSRQEATNLLASRVGDEWSRRPGERNPFRLHFVVDPQHSFKATSVALDRISI
jgi:hypothetical protein